MTFLRLQVTRTKAALSVVLFLCFSLFQLLSWGDESNLRIVCSVVIVLSSFVYLLLVLFGPSTQDRVKQQEIKIAVFREVGLYPTHGRATDDDVRRLVQIGENLLAVRLYREVHPQVPFKEAFYAVKNMK